MLTPYQFASNTPIRAIDLDGLEAQDATGVWREETYGGTYTHVQDDIYIYQRIVNGKSEFYHNAFSEGQETWTRIRSNDPKFSKYSHEQTGTGFGLSVNGVAGKDQFTEDTKNIFAGLLAIGGGAPLLGAASSSGGLTELFAVSAKGAGAKFLADATSQWVMQIANSETKGSYFENYNVASGVFNTFMVNPYLANGLASYMDVSFATVSTSVETGNLGNLTTSAEQGLVGGVLGGVLGSGSNAFFGQKAVEDYLGPAFLKGESKWYTWQYPSLKKLLPETVTSTLSNFINGVTTTTIDPSTGNPEQKRE
jgi:hypothetical protein